MAKLPYKLVYIEWIDAEADNGWRTEDEVRSEENGKPCTTVGFLIRKPSKSFAMYMIASTVAMDEGNDTWLHNGIMKVPKQWVKSMREINEHRPDDKPSES